MALSILSPSMKLLMTSNKYKILMVEDEIIIADLIAHYLQENGHEVVGIAISFDQAVSLYKKFLPDLTLLDIRIRGVKNGIDVARFFRSDNMNHTFIYLTSQLDQMTLDDAKMTYPAGYLTKPIQKASLFTTIEIAMHNGKHLQPDHVAIQSITLRDGDEFVNVAIDEILYFQAEHVYVKCVFKKRKSILMRAALKEVLKELPNHQFIRSHRSFVINLSAVDRWSSTHTFIANEKLPMSRSRRKGVLQKLNSVNTI